MNAVSTASEHRVANVRIPTGSPEYNEVVEFLYDEAVLLDGRRYTEWTELLAEDLTYTAPLRQTRAHGDKHGDIVRTMGHFDDTYASIMGRVGRLNTKTAWAEDPPSRTRRMITNVRMYTTDKADEYEVVSYILLARSRGEESLLGMLSGERHDRIRRVPGGFKIARREIILDQAVLGQANLAVFL